MLTPTQLIRSDRIWLLQAAYAYNHLNDCIYTDASYDRGIHYLKLYRKHYPEEWAACSIYPEVFTGNNDWTYTSSYFPHDETVVGWYEEQQARILEGEREQQAYKDKQKESK